MRGVTVFQLFCADTLSRSLHNVPEGSFWSRASGLDRGSRNGVTIRRARSADHWLLAQEPAWPWLDTHPILASP